MLAQWKLAKIYANGDGVPRDDIKAYDYFSQIVANYDEDDPNRRDLAVVSSALVSLGNYNLNGIANSKVRADLQRALQMFQFAATTFGDANAQYNLARMHLDGAGVDKDGREAIRWLFLAADKGHLQAEALLGQTLFTGREGVRPQRALGLGSFAAASRKLSISDLVLEFGTIYCPSFLTESVGVNDGRSLHQGRELAASLATRILRKH